MKRAVILNSRHTTRDLTAQAALSCAFTSNIVPGKFTHHGAAPFQFYSALRTKLETFTPPLT